MILLDNKEYAQTLRRMSRDGRTPNKSWEEHDNIHIVGFHYYMSDRSFRFAKT